jgi:bacillolysin
VAATRVRTATTLVLGGIVIALARPSAQPPPRNTLTAATAAQPAGLRSSDGAVDAMLRAGELEVRRRDTDTLTAGRTHTRMRQMYRGVPVLGADVTRQTDAIGATVSIFGRTWDGLDLDVAPAFDAGTAATIVSRLSGVAPGPLRPPVLCVFPSEAGSHLAYTATVFTLSGATAWVIDAVTGEVLQQTDALRRQSAVGTGTGVLGELRKLSVTPVSGVYAASDALRPPSLVTFDMRGNLQRTLEFLNGRISLLPSDRAVDTDNQWSDGAVVDAHASTGFFYDYYFKRFGRRGLDNDDFRLISLVHPAARADYDSHSDTIRGTYYLNAFYAGGGVMVYGDGIPDDRTAFGLHWNYLAGGLDVVAHELTHGVTEFTSNLIYQNESGALNESFSDMMGTAVEFFYEEPGSGPLRADYLIAEDVVTPGGIRSMANPLAYGQPDHYSQFQRLPLDDDDGGVHVNSGIPNQMYYLAIEGGTNRTSGLSVQGVGQANREQIEKVMYRAFTQLMPASATFAIARAATIQAATDLYGASSAAARAVTQAWDAVGVR